MLLFVVVRCMFVVLVLVLVVCSLLFDCGLFGVCCCSLFVVWVCLLCVVCW